MKRSENGEVIGRSDLGVIDSGRVWWQSKECQISDRVCVFPCLLKFAACSFQDTESRSEPAVPGIWRNAFGDERCVLVQDGM